MRAPLMAAVGARGVTVIADNPITPGTTTQNLVVNLNANDPVGAFRLVTIVLNKAAGPNATPTGWTLVGTTTTTGHSQSVYYRFKQSGDANSVTFVVSDGAASVTYGGSVNSRSGVSTTWPIQDKQVTTFSSTLAPDLPAATVAVKNSMSVGIISADTWATYTPPAGFTERLDSGGPDLSLEVVDRAYRTTGSQNPAAGTATVVLSNVTTSRAYTTSPAPHASYPDTGGTELTDGTLPAAVYTDAGWTAWQAQTPVVVVTLAASKTVYKGGAHLLEDTANSIYLPTGVLVEVGDGTTYSTLGTIVPTATGTKTVSNTTGVTGTRVRYTFNGNAGAGRWTFLGEVTAEAS